MNRRKAIKRTGLGLATLTGLGYIKSMATDTQSQILGESWKINVFSKHLHWAKYDEMASVVKDIGFDGIDLTVRPKGHVEPANAERDIPKAVEAADKKGVEVPMMTTAIRRAEDPHTEPILRSASKNGIKVYRTGWYKYDGSISIQDNIVKFGTELKKIGELNAKYGIIGDYQNHSGLSGGAPVWDIQQMLEIADSEYIGVQYDIRHAMVEGLKAWPLGLRLLAPHIHSLDIKDYEYVKKDKGWDIRNVPLGEGAVDFKSYFKLLKELKVRAPLSIHYEYSLGGADKGKFELTIPKEKVIEAMVRDLNYLKSVI